MEDNYQEQQETMQDQDVETQEQQAPEEPTADVQQQQQPQQSEQQQQANEQWLVNLQQQQQLLRQQQTRQQPIQQQQQPQPQQGDDDFLGIKSTVTSAIKEHMNPVFEHLTAVQQQQNQAVISNFLVKNPQYSQSEEAQNALAAQVHYFKQTVPGFANLSLSDQLEGAKSYLQKAFTPQVQAPVQTTAPMMHGSTPASSRTANTGEVDFGKMSKKEFEEYDRKYRNQLGLNTI